MKKDTKTILERGTRPGAALIGKSLIVGIAAGLVTLLYRLALSYADTWLKQLIAFFGQSLPGIIGWFLILIAMGLIVGRLVAWEPLISGSGIPQLEGEMIGRLNPSWWRVLSAKFVGGFLCLLGGLSLGREGPSIQLGAMAGKGVSKAMKSDKTEEKVLLTCGASAGLAAAFHAPLAGVMFSLEEVHKNFSANILVCAMTAAITADFISSQVFGTDSVFQLGVTEALPQRYYWALIVLGILLGAMGALYNKVILAAQSLYKKVPGPAWIRVVIPFVAAGFVAFLAPELLGSGHALVDEMVEGNFVVTTLILLFIGKLLYSAVCFGSGAPGGIFFPLLVLGSLLGCIFGTVFCQAFGLEMTFINNFILLAMAGYFTAIVRAPLTGIVLIFEMTGSVSQLLSLALVSLAAYITANALRSQPIYESLLERLLAGRGQAMAESGEKILAEFAISLGSTLDELHVRDARLPEECLLVTVRRGGEEILPKGNTQLMGGDVLVVLLEPSREAEVYEQMKNLCE